MIAERGNETVKSERTSSLITIAKARVWASEGWQVTITDDEGKVFAPAEFEDLLAAQSARGYPSPAMAVLRSLERFRAKWRPVRVKKTRQNQESRAPYRFYRNGKMLLAAQIIGIAGALETGHCFRKFVERGVKLVGAPGKFRLENFASP